MELIFYGNGATNFGDDLNVIVWKHVLPSWVFDVEDVALLGIGSIFTDQWTNSPKIAGKRVFVLGSGAGYWPLPRNMSSWTILALRGPLSAALIERPELAATDAAALLSVIPPQSPAPETRDSVLLVPHHESLHGVDWKGIADLAGVTFVDPTWPLEVVMSHFSKAKLVLAEAMHAAIVADTLRIPWIPWAASPYILPFKWVDWTSSLNMEYRPTLLPPTSAWGKLRYKIARVKAWQKGQQVPLNTLGIKQPSEYLADFRALYGGVAYPKRESPSALRATLRSTMIAASGLFDHGYSAPAAEALVALMRLEPFLSDERLLKRRVAQLQEAAGTLVRLLQ